MFLKEKTNPLHDPEPIVQLSAITWPGQFPWLPGRKTGAVTGMPSTAARHHPGCEELS